MQFSASHADLSFINILDVVDETAFLIDAVWSPARASPITGFSPG